MRHVTMNVRHRMLQRHAVADVEKAATLGGVIGWQEIDSERYKQAIRSLGPDWGHAFAAGGLAISWKVQYFELVDKGCVLTHHGKRRVSPNRYVQWVILRHRRTGIEFVRLNSQAVSGGWSKGWRPTTRWRREMWDIHMAALAKLVRQFHFRGVPVIGGGDMNRNRCRFLGEQVRYDINWDLATHGRRRYDYLFHVGTARVTIRCTGFGVVRGFFSDHDAAVAEYHLVPRNCEAPHPA